MSDTLPVQVTSDGVEPAPTLTIFEKKWTPPSARCSLSRSDQILRTSACFSLVKHVQDLVNGGLIYLCESLPRMWDRP